MSLCYIFLFAEYEDVVRNQYILETRKQIIYVTHRG